MKPPRQPPFVAEGIYRRRRLMDAARILPLVGAALVALPMFWAPGPGEERSTANDGIYLFVVWALLILGARLLGPGLDQRPGRGSGNATGAAPGGVREGARIGPSVDAARDPRAAAAASSDLPDARGPAPPGREGA